MPWKDCPSKCPNCGEDANSTSIYKCDECGKLWCNHCPDKTVRKDGSHRADNVCPNCGSNRNTLWNI